MDYPLSHNQITDSHSISLSEMNQQFPSRGGLCFYIRQTKTDYPTTIYATYYIRGVKRHVSLGIKVKPSQWDRQNHQARVSKTYSEADNLNNRIANAKLKRIEFGFLDKNSYLCNADIEIVEEKQNEKLINPNIMANNRYSKKSVQAATVTQLMRNSAREFVQGRSYETEISKINRFLKFLKASRLSDSFESMTYDNMVKFNTWLNSPKNNLTLETASQTLRAIKKYLKRFGNQPIYKFNYYNSGIDGIKPPKDTRTTEEIHGNYIALTHQQIEKLAGLEIVNDDFLSTCRVLFLMQCYSGIRVSDMQQLLNPDKYRVCDGVPFVVFVPKKTNKRKFKEANIPLNTLYPQLLTLYNKYKGKTFKFLPTTDDERSDKSYNEAIKRLGLMCGWHDEVISVETKGGKKRVFRTELYKELTSHCGRHSFITNAVREFGMGLNDVIRITGHHDTEQITSRYLNLKSGEDAKLLNKSLESKGIGVNKSKAAKSALKGKSDDYGIEDEKEALRVLRYLGVDTTGMEDKPFADLINEVGQHQGELYDEYGVTYEIMKPLFNVQTSMAKRKELLKVVCETMAK